MPHTLIKVCGLTGVDEALECVRAGVDWIGLNFHPASPRYVSRALAGEMIRAIPRPARAVGLFVNRPAGEVAGLATELGLEIIQLHGDEPPEDLLALDRFFLVRAFRVGNAAHLEEMASYLLAAARLGRSPDAILVDAHVPGREGGTGTVVPDPILDALPEHGRLILAGGLSPRNVADRVSRVRPWMVDTASGVESSPGRKDPTLVRAFIDAIRAGESLPGKSASAIP